ncbi:hypothetical protein ILUMI_10345, partial [Ignelater luminosus]
MDNSIRQKSKRQGILHSRGALIKGATSKPQNVQVIKHFEPSKSIHEITELPYLVTEDDDDELISAHTKFHPSRHVTRQNTTVPSKNQNKITKAKTRLIGKIEYSVLPNDDCNKQKNIVLNKNKGKKNFKLHNKRSSSVASSQSSSETKHPFKKPRPSQPTSKSSAKIDSILNLKNGVNQLNSKLDELENQVHVTIKKKYDKYSDRFVEKTISRDKKCTFDKETNPQKPYSFVTASYIKSLKDEIESARISSKELHKSAQSLRAEISRFRNSAEYVNSKAYGWKSYADTSATKYQKENVSGTLGSLTKQTQYPLTQDAKLQVLGFNSLVNNSDKKCEFRCSGTQYETVISSGSSSTTENQITVLLNTKSNEFQNAEKGKELVTLFHKETPSKNDNKSEDNEFTLTISVNTDNENESRLERRLKYDEIKEELKTYSPCLSEKLSKISNKDKDNENLNTGALSKPNISSYLETIGQPIGKIITV